MTDLYLLRHGKVNGPAALYGHTDIKVQAGHDQQLLDELLKVKQSFTHIISSPLQRCNNLARQFSNLSGLPLTTFDCLKEISFGDLDGKAFDTVKEQWPVLEKFWQNPAQHPLPNSESLDDFYARINDAFKHLILNFNDQRLLLICHGGVIRMLLSIVLELDYKNPKLFSHLRIENGSISKISHNNSAQFSQVEGINLPILSSLSAEPFGGQNND